MEIDRIFNVSAPLAMSSVFQPSSLPQTIRDTDQRNQADNAAVKLNLSSAAQNILSTQSDVVGTKPVPETDKQEGRPSGDQEQQSRDDSEARQEAKR